MSDPIDREPEPAPDEPGARPDEAGDELRSEDLEQASGGVIEGGCIRLPWERPFTTG